MKIVEVKKKLKRSDVLVGMLTVQAISTGLQLLSKVILNHGTFIFALMTYRHIVATLCMAPFAFIWERDSLKKVTWSLFFWLFIIALIGIVMAMGLYYYGLRDTNATYATNFLNLIPVMTFIFSTVLRVEKLRLNTKAGKVKLVGAMLCLAGALTITLYKGKVFYIFHHKHDHDTKATNWVRGTLFLVGSCMSYGSWFLLQVKASKVFPYKYSSTFVICIIASIQSVIVGLCIDRRKASWKLGFNLQLITIFYSGALATAATFCLVSWAVARRGPTYPSMFNPLALICVTIAEAAFFGQEISIGSLLGMFFIIVGLYLFLRAKSRELTRMISNVNSVGVPPPDDEISHPRDTEISILTRESASFQTRAIEVVIPIQAQAQAREQCIRPLAYA